MSEKRVIELEGELEALKKKVSEAERPSYAGLGGRANELLRLAEEEAEDIRNQAVREATEISSQANADAKAIRADASREAEDMRSEEHTSELQSIMRIS